MKLQILAVGKLKHTGLRGVCDDYRQRIGRHVQVEERELKDDAALRKALPADGFVVALQVGGKSLTSSQLAERIGRWREDVRGPVTFVIGGAEGIPSEVDARADFRLSLSNLTLPHRLARVLLLEQLYRSFSILNNEPYARED